LASFYIANFWKIPEVVWWYPSLYAGAGEAGTWD